MNGLLRRAGVLLVAAAASTAVLVPAPSSAAQAPQRPPRAAAAEVPRTAVMDGAELSEAKSRLEDGDPALREAVDKLVVRADGWLDQGPWTVVDKPQPAPGGDPHDYLSQAPYWWPTEPKTEDNPWGCPYEQRDGERNPDVDTGTDHPDRGKVFDSVSALALAWYYTGKAEYAEHAETILRTWFTDPDTRMNPDLGHAQFIPCEYDGRAIGIIDFSQAFTSLVDATALLDTGAPGWSAEDQEGMRSWYQDFQDWLVNSDFGKEEAAADNNHGSFYDMQVAALAVATGDDDLARRTVEGARKGRIDPQIAGDGSQPGEISRTRSWHYSTFNLVALTRLAAVGKHVGVDLWSYEGPDGGSLRKAVGCLLPAATGASPWEHPELDFHAYAASDVVHAAADAGDTEAQAAVEKLEAPPGGDLWALRPAAEQLDTIEN